MESGNPVRASFQRLNLVNDSRLPIESGRIFTNINYYF